MPTISVIMTAFNAMPYLRPAIESILGQTFRDFEFIIVDDGSDDGSRSLIESYSDPRIRYYFRPHQGRVNALNFACSVHQGEYIAIADADDISSSERFRVQLDFFQHHPRYDVVGSWVRRTDEHGNTIRVIRYPISHIHIVDTMPYSCSVSFPAAMIRSELLETDFPFNPAYLVAHDLDFWLRILPTAQFGNVPQPLVSYRARAGSLAHKHARKAREETHSLAVDFFNRTEQLDSETRLFGLARVEYYHGAPSRARMLFAKLLIRSPLSLRYWRYILPTLLGGRILSLIRRTRIARLPGIFSRFISTERSLSPP